MPNIYNYAGEANPNNVRTGDPTALRAVGVSVNVTGLFSAVLLGVALVAADAGAGLDNLAASAASGTVTIAADANPAASGLASPAALGTLTLTIGETLDLTVELPGQAAAVSLGDVTVTTDASVGNTISEALKRQLILGGRRAYPNSEPPSRLVIFEDPPAAPAPARRVSQSVTIPLPGASAAVNLGRLDVETMVTVNFCLPSVAGLTSFGQFAPRAQAAASMPGLAIGNSTTNLRINTVQNLSDDDLLAVLNLLNS